MSDKEENKELEKVTKEELKQEQDDKDEQDSTCSTSTEGNNEPHKELGLVITALQSTVKHNSEKEVKHEYDIHEADELHSDIEDLQSVTTIESNTDDTTTSTTAQEKLIEIKHVEEIGHEENDHKEIDHKVEESKEKDNLEDITDQILPATEEEIASLAIEDDIVPPTPGIAPKRQTFELHTRTSEDALDTDSYSENLIALNKINIKDIQENTLSPRQQEKAGNYSNSH